MYLYIVIVECCEYLTKFSQLVRKKYVTVAQPAPCKLSSKCVSDWEEYKRWTLKELQGSMAEMEDAVHTTSVAQLLHIISFMAEQQRESHCWEQFTWHLAWCFRAGIWEKFLWSDTPKLSFLAVTLNCFVSITHCTSAQTPYDSIALWGCICAACHWRKEATWMEQNLQGN